MDYLKMRMISLVLLCSLTLTQFSIAEKVSDAVSVANSKNDKAIVVVPAHEFYVSSDGCSVFEKTVTIAIIATLAFYLFIADNPHD